MLSAIRSHWKIKPTANISDDIDAIPRGLDASVTPRAMCKVSKLPIRTTKAVLAATQSESRGGEASLVETVAGR
jgi:hypothetical protein